MTFQKLVDDLGSGVISPQEAYDAVQEQKKKINYYVYLINVKQEPLDESQLQELDSIVNLLQMLYNSSVDSPISDQDYDILEEALVNDGIPRLTGTVELNDAKKLHHEYPQLRGTLDKVYYLTNDEPRTNKSRKTLDEWIASAENRYYRNSGKRINLNEVKIIAQPKFDGSSTIVEWDGKNAVWLTRGDTTNNLASDVTHIMKAFNDVYCSGQEPCGIKFECMCTEENKDKINSLVSKPYKNSRQIVTSTLNSVDPDFKVNYLYPVPLRLLEPGEAVEQVHPMLIEKFPTLFCTFADREKIREFGEKNKYVEVDGMHFRTDGVVMTILDPNIQRILGREGAINQFEVALKHTEETAYSKVKDVEFYVSEFGHITPVLVVNDVMLKGNTVNHISLSNKDRFDELDLHYGDTVCIHYDIIPYVTIDANCKRQPYGRKVEFIKACPRCHEPLDLSETEVQCKNPRCPSRIVGRIQNYCTCVRIRNIGYSTLDTLYSVGLLPHGIRSLYKLKKKIQAIEDLDGFGRLKAHKLVNEIEAKRRLKDYEFFGALGIEGIGAKTFQQIFSSIKLDDFMHMIQLKNFSLMEAQLTRISGVGPSKADLIIKFFKDAEERNEFLKLCEEVTLTPTYVEPGSTNASKGRIVFTGCRPSEDMRAYIESKGYEPSDSWSNSAKMLVIPYDGYSSNKVGKASTRNIPIVTVNNLVEVLE